LRSATHEPRRKNPAQAAKMGIPNNLKGLIDEAIKYEAKLLMKALARAC